MMPIWLQSVWAVLAAAVLSILLWFIRDYIQFKGTMAEAHKGTDIELTKLRGDIVAINHRCEERRIWMDEMNNTMKVNSRNVVKIGAKLDVEGLENP